MNGIVSLLHICAAYPAMAMAQLMTPNISKGSLKKYPLPLQEHSRHVWMNEQMMRDRFLHCAFCIHGFHIIPKHIDPFFTSFSSIFIFFRPTQERVHSVVCAYARTRQPTRIVPWKYWPWPMSFGSNRWSMSKMKRAFWPKSIIRSLWICKYSIRAICRNLIHILAVK